MTDQIIPRTLFDVASDMESEASNLKACIGLMEKALSFGYSEPEEAARAQAQMIFLASCLGDLQKRFDAITAAAYEICWAQKAAHGTEQPFNPPPSTTRPS